MSDSNSRGFFGSPGTRIVKRESEESEIKAYIRQIAIVALTGDVFLVCVMLSAVLAGYWSVVPLTIIIAFCLAWLIQWLLDIRFPLILFGRTFTRRKAIRIIFLCSGIAGGIFAKPVWRWITGYDAIMKSATAIYAAFSLPWYVYAAFVGLTVFLLMKGMLNFIQSIIIVAPLAITWAIYKARDAVLWDVLLPRLMIVGIFLVLPFIFAAVLITFVAVKNTLWPYLDYNLKPFDLSELRDVGLIGLLFPNLIGGKPRPPKPDRVVKIDISERCGHGLKHKYLEVPDDLALLDFFRSVMRGASFSVRDAVACGVSRTEFERIRDLFIERGLAFWNNPKAKARGVSLNVAGKRVVAELASLPHPD